jgi:lipid-binding SYLF domain-containing protein
LKNSTFAMVIGGLLLAVAATAQAKSDDALIADAKATMAQFKKADPGLAKFAERSAGYVVFPGIGKGAVGVGGAHGSGVVFEKGKPVGKAELTQVTVGLQIGGQAYSEVVFFETPAVLAAFKKGDTKFSSAVSAVALKTGASANAKFTDGVAVFTATKGGLMLEASVGGQHFDFEAFPTSGN